MHDPTAIFRFEEHDIYLPMVVLEELDANKKGLSEASRNARQVSRFLDDMMRDVTKEQIDAGLRDSVGRARQSRQEAARRAAVLPDRGTRQRRCPRSARDWRRQPDPRPDAVAAEERTQTRVTLVSKDINLRIKAAIVGVHAEDYYSDKTIDDADVLYTGIAGAARGFLGAARQGHALLEGARPHLVRGRRARGARLVAEPVRLRGQRRRHRGDGAQARRRAATLELARDFRSDRHSVWGITARNREQNFALNLLHGSGDRLRHAARAGRHRQDTARAGRRAGADARAQPLRRDHHDARHRSARRGHRLPARHRRGEDGALDGRADGQPRGADATARKAATGAARPPTICCATASRSARSTSCAAAPS